jgi:hypothetical protein
VKEIKRARFPVTAMTSPIESHPFYDGVLVQHVSLVCAQLALPMPFVTECDDANKSAVITFDGSSLVGPYDRPLLIYARHTWRDKLRSLWFLFLDEPRFELYQGKDFAMFLRRLVAHSRATPSGSLLCVLFPELRKLIRSHLGAVARARLRATCRLCYGEDFAFRTPKPLARPCKIYYPFVTDSPDFRSYARAWMSHFDHPCFTWISSEGRTVYSSHEPGWVLWINCVRCSNSSVAYFSYKSNKWIFAYFGCRQCHSEKRDEFSTDTLIDMWEKHGKKINAYLFM